MKKKDVLVCIHLILLFFCIYHTFPGEKLWGCMYLVTMVLAVFFLGKRFRIRAGFLIVGALMEAGMLCLFYNQLAEQVIFTIAFLVTAVSYTLYWAEERKPIFLEIIPVWMLFILLCHVPLFFTGYTSKYLRIFGILYFLLYLLGLAVDNMEDFKLMHSRMEYLPLVQLGKVWFFSVLSVLLWVLFGMLLGRNERLSDDICGKIQAFLRSMDNVHLRLTPQEGVMFMELSQEDMGAMMPHAIKEMEQVSNGSQILGYGISFLLLLLCLVLVLFALYSLYCYLKRNKRDEEDEIEFISASEQDEYLYLEPEKHKKSSKTARSANEMIRRKYKKKIKTALSKQVPVWASPMELEHLAGWQQSHRDKELHKLYEKARYSEEGCEMEEIDRYNNSDDKNDR